MVELMVYARVLNSNMHESKYLTKADDKIIYFSNIWRFSDWYTNLAEWQEDQNTDGHGRTDRRCGKCKKIKPTLGNVQKKTKMN